MQKEIVSITNVLGKFRQQAYEINGVISKLNHSDIGINGFINRLKKLSLQSLDLYNEMNRQLGFLTNENKSFEIREKFKLDREKRERKYKSRRM
jgi:hypothetical protein